MFKKNPKQILAVDLITLHKYLLLYGGSRSGKTALFTRQIGIRAAAKPSRHLITRFHFKDCKTSMALETFPEIMELAEIPFHMNKTDWYATLRNGSQIWFGGLDDKDRTEKILGKEYSTIYLNECSQISWKAATIAMTRLAQKSGLTLKMFFDCNPPTIKHWLHKLFIEQIMPDTEQALKNPGQYGHMQMNPIDNLINLGEGYLEILEGLPKRQRQRFLDGLFQSDVEGAMWDQAWIESTRVDNVPLDLERIVVAIDPAVSSNENSDETGIIVAGKKGDDYYILEDTSKKLTPSGWGNKGINAYERWKADLIVGEVNNGGDLIETVLRNIDKSVNYKAVHATRGKVIRAEPIAALYEKGQIHHVGQFPELEDQMTSFTHDYNRSRDGSPDRLDAMVWALTELNGSHIQWEVL